MSHYAVGDLQGCRAEFNALLEAVELQPTDRLWLLGDLINRGADSLGTLEDVYARRAQCEIVLGNHDLHFLAIYYGGHSPSNKDTFDDLLKSSRLDEYAGWLSEQKILHSDEQLGYCMVHAGIPHIWSFAQAQTLAREVESAMRDRHPDVSRQQFFSELYGNEPACWDDGLQGMPRLRAITNYLTRMRLVDERGCLEFAHKGALKDAPAGWSPWYQLHKEARPRLLFGHWAALDGVTGRQDILALDTGCVWGRQLTALCLETGIRTSVDHFS